MSETPKKTIKAKASVILDELLEYLHNNEELKQFCWDNFGSVGLVQEGFDKDSPPRPEELPAVRIGPVQRSEKGDSNQEISFLIFVSVTISETGIENTALDNADLESGDVSLKTQARRKVLGSSKVEKFREEVERLILCAPIQFIRRDLAGETLPESDFPIFRSHTAITFGFKRSSRGPTS